MRPPLLLLLTLLTAAAGAAAAAPPKPGLYGRYLLAYGSCDAAGQACREELAQSLDGVRWFRVAGFVPRPGQRPVPVRRGNRLYVFDGRSMRRFSVGKSSLTELAPASLQLDLPDPEQTADAAAAAPETFSADVLVDAAGSLVMAYAIRLEPSTGLCPTQDLACMKIRTATEVAGSDGTAFTGDPRDRAVLELGPADAVGTPSVFRGRSGWVVLLTGPGGCLHELQAGNLRGAYRDAAGLPGGCLAPAPSPVSSPSGFWNPRLREYWLYGVAEGGLERAVAARLNAPLPATRFRLLTGLGAGRTVAAARFAVNAP